MLNFIVPAYITIVFSVEAVAGLALSLQTETSTVTNEQAAEEAVESIITQPGLPTLEEEIVAPAPVAVPNPDAATYDAASAETTPESQVRIVPEAEWGLFIQPARDALSRARTARGRFTQINADNTISTGSFALRRPGRMRFDYDAPSPILIIADGATVAISDSNLETVDRVPLSTTPLNILLDEQITFSSDVEVLQVLERPESIAITVRDLTGDLDGRLSLIFAESDFSLMGWIAIDTEGQIVQVSLENTEANVSVNPILFRLSDPADDEDDR